MSSDSKAASPRKWRVTVLISGSGSNLGALMAALPTTLHDCTITHVISSKSSAYGLTRAASHSPPIPTSVHSLVSYRKKHSGLSPDAQRDGFCLELAAAIRETKPDLVVLAGWMLILSAGFLEALTHDWEEKDVVGEGETPRYDGQREKGRPIPIINLHPALPGTFPGAHAIDNAWEAFNDHPDAPKNSPAKSGKVEEKEGEVVDSLGKLSLAKEDAAVEESVEHKPRITKTGIMVHRVIPLLDAGDPVVVKEVEMIEGESLEGLEARIHKVEHPALVEAVAEVVKQLGEGVWWQE